MKTKFYFILIFLFLILSCNRSKKNDESSEIELTDSQNVEVIDTASRVMNLVDENVNNLDIRTASYDKAMYKSLTFKEYEIPSPIEIMSILENHEANFTLLNSPKNTENYLTITQKAINIGIYSTDMIYCLLHNQNQDFIIYYETILKLTHEFGIESGFKPELIEKFNENIEKNDSLRIYANTAFMLTSNYLEKNNNLNILPFMIMGAWLEGMYLFTNTAINSIEDNQLLFQEICKQDAIINNLMQFFNDVMLDITSYKANSEIQILLSYLQDLSDLYTNLEINENTIISVEDLKLINEKITQIRNEYVL